MKNITSFNMINQLFIKRAYKRMMTFENKIKFNFSATGVNNQTQQKQLKTSQSQLHEQFKKSSSSEEIKHKKSWQNPQIKQQFQIYKPKQPLHFVNGRKLLYLNRQNLLTPFLITSHITLGMIYLGYLIKINPWYLSFPAALPIMVFAQIGLFFRYCFHKAHYKYHVQRIYLLQDGIHVQFIFSNKIRTALKDRQKSIIHPAIILKTPVQQENIVSQPLKGLLFPQSKQKIQYPSRLRYAWSKYIQNRTNYMIPGRFEYMDWQLMIPIMNGSIVDVQNCTKQGQLKRKAPTLEEQQDRLQEQLKSQNKVQNK